MVSGLAAHTCAAASADCSQDDGVHGSERRAPVGERRVRRLRRPAERNMVRTHTEQVKNRTWVKTRSISQFAELFPVILSVVPMPVSHQSSGRRRNRDKPGVVQSPTDVVTFASHVAPGCPEPGGASVLSGRRHTGRRGMGSAAAG